MQNNLSPFFAIALFFITVSWNFTEILGKQEQPDHATIEKFRASVEDVLYKDYMHTEKYLIPWLKASKMDIGRARERIYKAHEWRRTNKVDSVLEEDFSNILKQCPIHSNIVDRNGRPVMAVSLGKCSMRKLVLSGSRWKNQRFLMRILESMGTQIYQSRNDNVTQCGILADLHGFNMRQHACLACIPFIIDFVTFYEAYYPEALKYVISINTPRIVETTFTSLLGPLASQATVIGIRAYGLNKEEWRERLLKEIPAEQLTLEYGGTRKTFQE